MTGTKRRLPATPKGLGAIGKRLWKVILDDVPEEAELDARELEILTTACRQADMIGQLETALKSDGVMVRGAQGQPRLNAVVTELRQSRIALARLLGELGFEDDVAGMAPTASARRASRAAHARWGTSPAPAAAQGSLNGDA